MIDRYIITADLGYAAQVNRYADTLPIAETMAAEMRRVYRCPVTITDRQLPDGRVRPDPTAK